MIIQLPIPTSALGNFRAPDPAISPARKIVAVVILNPPVTFTISSLDIARESFRTVLIFLSSDELSIFADKDLQ